MEPAVMIPKELAPTASKTIVLPHKPSASIHYNYAHGTSDNILVVFLNGLMTDRTSWIRVMAGVMRQRKGTAAGSPSLLSYDRYGQGTTEDRDPQDEGREEGHGHDCADAAEDLHYLVEGVVKEQMCVRAEDLRLVLVANSIGCAIARIYAQTYPVAALLLLDPIIANSDFDFWPNPDTTDIRRPADLPHEVTDEILRQQRARFAAIFHPSVSNKEGLSRRNLADLLPHSDSPMLGTDGNRPWVTVVGHDFDAFAEESLKTMGTPKSLSMMHSNPAWDSYNKGLAKLTGQDRSKGPIQAKGCGHFIQHDDPNFVVDETLELVDKVRLQQSAVW